MSLPFEGFFQTILIAEHDPDVLRVVRLILQGAGFTILSAASPSEAASIAQDFKGTIHLLLSDLDMPGMTGPRLATNLRKMRPQLRVILMSGQADGALLILNYGWHFIRKPFLPETLVVIVRDILIGESREQTTDRFDPRK
jgi:two-component system cell cycle sensor histidine kinase/response regulator CckA